MFCFCIKTVSGKGAPTGALQALREDKKVQCFVFAQHHVNTTGTLIAKPHCLHY